MINEHDCVVLTIDPDTLVQLFCLSSSVIIGRRYDYERTRISAAHCLSELESSMSSVQIGQKSYEMPPREGISIAHFLTVADIERSDTRTMRGYL